MRRSCTGVKLDKKLYIHPVRKMRVMYYNFLETRPAGLVIMLDDRRRVETVTLGK